MRIKLFLLSERWHHDTDARDYLLRTLADSVGHPDELHFMSPKGLGDELDKLSEEDSDGGIVLIAAEGRELATAARIGATWLGEGIVMREGLMMPQCAHRHDGGGFVVRHGSWEICYLRLDGQNLPVPLAENRKGDNAFAYLFGRDITALERLIAPIAQASEIDYELFPDTGGWIRLYAQARRYGNLALFLSSTRKLLTPGIIVADDLWAHTVASMTRAGVKLGIAESCTGGLIAARLTAVSGSSAIFDGGLVTYANIMKEKWLGVGEPTLIAHGAVSQECVAEMLKGTLERTGADLALAVSGIAGPTGGSADKPVGTVYVGMASAEGNLRIDRLSLSGDRAYIRAQAAQAALRILIEEEKNIFQTS